MERSIIDYIYDTDEIINDEVYAVKEYRDASEKALQIYDKFKEMLTEEQIDEFEKFIERETEQQYIRMRVTFKCGVKYGVRFVAESMLG